GGDGGGEARAARGPGLGGGGADVAGADHPGAELLEPRLEAGVSDRRRAHVDATPARAQVERSPDDGDGLRRRFDGHGEVRLGDSGEVLLVRRRAMLVPTHRGEQRPPTDTAAPRRSRPNQRGLTVGPGKPPPRVVAYIACRGPPPAGGRAIANPGTGRPPIHERERESPRKAPISPSAIQSRRIGRASRRP